MSPMTRSDFPVALVAALWLGFVLAISFMESWLRFRAPGVTRVIGLSIGKLVFKALNRVEWALAAATAMLVITGPAGTTVTVLACALFALLAVQTFLLLPHLDRRVDRIVAGEQPPRSPAHAAFVAMEMAKASLLATLAWLASIGCLRPFDA